ncbi:MAG: DNA/RNA nuclease SfsA [Gammaproteobacteria bacterium]|nr:DNA/RNA nuclease SfsA [Gammaproteobacteria bacterium]MBQ0839601.1 DNA/RNA nuclease SfsA [Gammaproteobacteria bacterium]
MKISPAFEMATFIKRYKRFFADIELSDGSELTIHCANTGSMKNCLSPGQPCWFSRSDNPKRKLPGTLEIITTAGGRLAGVNTARPNKLVVEAIENGVISELQAYDTLRTEVRYGEENSRIDILLEEGDAQCFIEVKSVTLEAEGQRACFPDAVTARGSKHLRELMHVVEQGQRGVLVFCVQLTDIEEVAAAQQIDPVYAQTLAQAMAAGVEVLVYGCRLSPDEIVIDRQLRFLAPPLV